MCCEVAMSDRKGIGGLGLWRSQTVASLGVKSGIRHEGRIALSGWQSCSCLALCPDMPCGVQMAGWNEGRGGTLLSQCW